MERGKRTTAAVLFWTPAPTRTSSRSSGALWQDESEEQGEKDDDFVNQMDENGIIGLSEALEVVELSGTSGNADWNPDLYCGRITPDLGRRLVEPSYNPNLSQPESPGEDLQTVSQYDDLIGSLTVDEDVRQRNEEQGTGCLLERDKYLDFIAEQRDGEETEKRNDRKKKRNEHNSTSRNLGTVNDLAERSQQSCSTHLSALEAAGVSNHHCPTFQPTSAVTPPAFHQLLHFTDEEVACAQGIEAESFPEISFIESPPDSHRSSGSIKSSPPRPETQLQASLLPADNFSEELMSNHYSGVSNGPLKGTVTSDQSDKRPTPSLRKMRQHSPGATYPSGSLCSVRTDSSKFKHQTLSPDREPRRPRGRNSAAEVDESRKESLSYRTPDFSKVEPKVRFPKGSYKPPKSRRSFKRDSLSPEPPVVFKSPADIVKEVLLNIPDGSPAPQDSYTPPTNAPDFTVPQEFRCPQQAAALLEQLQEHYDTLLTKYAEAENTIDRLRLEAKVNLYSDPPKPGHSVQSGLNHEASRPMKLDFPQAQRAEINSSSLHPDGHTTHQRSSSAGPSARSPDPQVGQQAAQILCSQTDKFLQQLQIFEDLLKSKKLKPLEQAKGVSQLAEGLDSLERGYLLARDEHKLLQQHGTVISHFDPDRELEGLIFQCVLRMDELKEQVEQMRQQQFTCEAPPSSAADPTPSCAPSERGESLTQPQIPPVPSLTDPGPAAVVELSFASEESDEETLNSLDLTPLNGKHRHVERDFADPYQNFKELPNHLDLNQRGGAPLPAALKTNMQPGNKEKERQRQGTANVDVHKSLPQRSLDHVGSPVPSTSKQHSSKLSPPSRRASSQSTTLPIDHPSSSSRRRLEFGKSHSSSLSSLGEISASQRGNSKLLTGSSRVLSQDGIISPETDSGFVGSESSRLTPAAAPSPLHQRASESVAVPQDTITEKPQAGPVSAPPPAFSPSHRRTAVETNVSSQLGPEQLRRSRQGQRRRTFSCSPERWVRADRGTSESGLESDSTAYSVPEDRHTGSISSSSSSSPAVQRHHDDSFQALSSRRNEAIQMLQAEVNRLRERVDSCVRNRNPRSSVRAAPSAVQSTSTPRVRLSNVSRGRRHRQMVDEVDDATLRRTARARPPAAHRPKPQPDISLGPSPPQPPPLVSRCTQTTTAAPDSCCSHTNTVRSRTHPSVSVQVSETADGPDSRSRQAPLCPQCLSRQRGGPERPVGGNREPTHSSRCRHCPLCGCPELYTSTEPDCRRVSGSPPHTSRHPAQSPDGGVRSRHFTAAAPAALLQCMPVCSPPLLLYSTPLYVSPSNIAGTSSKVRDGEEMRGRSRSSLSIDKQRSVHSSLDRAIRAARNMKHTSGHMARSLAAGLHYQELLTQSCSY